MAEGSLNVWAPQPYFGLGVSYSYFSVDYAAMNPWSVFGMGHKFTLSLGF
jgi:hypothetical protein